MAKKGNNNSHCQSSNVETLMDLLLAEGTDVNKVQCYTIIHIKDRVILKTR